MLFFKYLLYSSFLTFFIYFILIENILNAIFITLIFYILSMFCLIIQKFDFIAIILLMIYAGAITILFIFVLILFNIKYEKQTYNINITTFNIILFFILIGLFYYLIVFKILCYHFQSYNALLLGKTVFQNIENIYSLNIAQMNFNVKALPFSLYILNFKSFFTLGLILLTAMIGIILILKK